MHPTIFAVVTHSTSSMCVLSCFRLSFRRAFIWIYYFRKTDELEALQWHQSEDKWRTLSGNGSHRRNSVFSFRLPLFLFLPVSRRLKGTNTYAPTWANKERKKLNDVISKDLRKSVDCSSCLFANTYFWHKNRRWCHKAHRRWNLLVWIIELLCFAHDVLLLLCASRVWKRERKKSISFVRAACHPPNYCTFQQSCVWARYFSRYSMRSKLFVCLFPPTIKPSPFTPLAFVIHTEKWAPAYAQSENRHPSMSEMEALIFEWNLFRTMICANIWLAAKTNAKKKQRKMRCFLVWFTLRCIMMYFSLLFFRSQSSWSTFYHNQMKSLKMFDFVQSVCVYHSVGWKRAMRICEFRATRK